MIKGIDISHWNSDVTVKSALTTSKFCIIKLTEGKTYIDAAYNRNIKFVKDSKAIIGFYHYAHPEQNTAVQEANAFVSTLKKVYLHGRTKNALLALDWEGKALNYPEEWAIAWLGEVYERTGIRPLFYVQASALDRFKRLPKMDYGLWVAKYTNPENTEPPIGKFPRWAMWQYSSTGYDHDIFNGTVAQLKKYAKPSK